MLYLKVHPKTILNLLYQLTSRLQNFFLCIFNIFHNVFRTWILHAEGLSKARISCSIHIQVHEFNKWIWPFKLSSVSMVKKVCLPTSFFKTMIFCINLTIMVELVESTINSVSTCTAELYICIPWYIKNHTLELKEKLRHTKS